MRTLIFGVLLFLMGWPVRADDRGTILRLIESPGGTISDLNIVGDWAHANWQTQDSGGYVVVHRLDGRWRVIRGAGGAVAPQTLFILGVPREHLSRLLGSPVSAQDIQEAVRQGPYWVMFTRDKTVGEDDLQGRSSWELTLMRNEIYAVHGRPFRDPVLRDYFESRAWYRADAGYNDSKLSARERANSQFILEYQRRHKLLD